MLKRLHRVPASDVKGSKPRVNAYSDTVVYSTEELADINRIMRDRKCSLSDAISSLQIEKDVVYSPYGEN